MYPYTVIGVYTDNEQPFSVVVQANDPRSAKIAGVQEALNLNGWDSDDARLVDVVAIVIGACELAADSGEVENGSEIFEKNSISTDILASYIA